MHGGVLLGPVGEIVVLVGVLGETVVLLVVEGFVELGPDALGGDGWRDSHAVTPTQAIRLIASNRIAFDMKVLSCFRIRSPASFEFCSGLVDLAVCVVCHGSVGHVCTRLCERFVSLRWVCSQEVFDRADEAVGLFFGDERATAGDQLESALRQ
jgi:hypothetical protein